MVPPSVPIPDTLRGVDDLIRIGFENFRAIWFERLLTATFIVVVGLVLEGPELWHETRAIKRHWSFTWRFRFSLPEESAPHWAKLLAFIGWVLIVGGVAGEFVADSFVSKADGYVQKFDEILLTEAQKGTAFATERASAAYERASENEKETASTLKQAEQERADAAKSLAAAETARKEAEGFQLQIAQANERAAEAERETARLKAELADRTLTDAQLKSIADKIDLYAGQEYDITPYRDSPESVGIADRIYLALIFAKWKFVPSKTIGLFGGVVGVQVWRHPDADERTKAAASALVAALLHEGIQALLRVENPQNNPKHNTISLNVGAKR
jgi:hypothetical protein